MNLDITRTHDVDESILKNVRATFRDTKWKFISISLGKTMDEEKDNFTYLLDGLRTPQIREELTMDELLEIRDACLEIDRFPDHIHGLVESILDLVDFEISKREIYRQGIINYDSNIIEGYLEGEEPILQES